MKTHLIPTVEEFAVYAQALTDEVGGLPLHPANRLTSCGKRMGDLPVTTNASRATCATCTKVGPKAGPK